MSRARRQTSLLLLAAWTRSAATLGLIVVLTRLLPPESFGRLRGAQVIALVGASFLVAGLPQSLLYLCPTSDASQRKSLLSATFVQLVALGCAAAVLPLVLFPWIGDRIAGLDSAALAAGVSLLIVGQALSLSAPTVALACGQVRRSAVQELALGLIPPIAAIVAAALGARPAVVLFSLGASYAALGLVCWRPQLRARELRLPDRVVLRRQWSLAGHWSVAALVGTVFLQADKLAVAALFPVGQFAVYAAGAIELPFVKLLPQVVTRSIAPRLAKMHAKGDVRGFLRLWHESLRCTALIMFPAALFGILTADSVLGFLLPAGYEASAAPFKVFLLLVPLRLTGFGLLVQSTGVARPVLLATVAGLIVCVATMPLTMMGLGAVGGAWSVVVGVFASSAFQLVAVRRRLDVGWRRFLPWARLATLGAVTIAAGLLGVTLTGGVGIPAGAVALAAFACGVLLSRSATLEDVRFLLPRRPPGAREATV